MVRNVSSSRARVSAKWRKIISLIPGYDAIATAPSDCHFDEQAAQDAVDFFSECLCHVEGKLQGEPLVLAPWQQAIIANIFGWKRADGTRRYRKAFIFVPRKNGKALALDTPIPTPDGWSRMGDLNVGDVVYDEIGEPCRVTYTTEEMRGRQCFRVQFGDGTAIVADADHLWTTETRKPEHGRSTVTTQSIRDTLRHGRRGDLNHSIPVAGSLECDKALLPIPPYVLGLWLGDGSSATNILHVGRLDQDEICSQLDREGVTWHEPLHSRNSPDDAAVIGIGLRVKGVCPRKHNQHEMRGVRCRACARGADAIRRGAIAEMLPCTNRSMVEDLRDLGVLDNKHVPPTYLRAAKNQRLALLQGLMDSDGYVSKAGQCEFTTIRRRLATDAIELIRSLGLKPTCKQGKATLYGRVVSDKYRVQFFGFQDMPVTRLRRKTARIKPTPSGRTRAMTRQIVAVDLVPPVPLRCIQVDSPSHLYLAGEGMVATHNTTFTAGIVCLVLFCDNERGAKIYSAAADREQASICFELVKYMVLHEGELKNRCRVYRRSITIEEEASAYTAISADAKTKHGYNGHLIIMDETHAQPNRELADVLRTSQGARTQPLYIDITTAGNDDETICGEKYLYACQVRDGLENPYFLPVIYEAPKGADWRDEKTWEIANPNLDISVKRSFLREECAKAQQESRERNAFQQLYLNIWTQSSEAWIDMDKWDACRDDNIDHKSLVNRLCCGGLDLSTIRDTTALAFLFPNTPKDGHYTLVEHIYIPEHGATYRERADDVSYLTWARENWVTLTDGEVIDYAYLRNDVVAASGIYNLREVGFDPWQAEETRQILADQQGIEMVKVRQGYQSMSEPAKLFYNIVTGGKLHHSGNPCTRWMVSNTALRKDTNDNIMPKKNVQEKRRIDVVVAIIIALSRAMVAVDQTSIYATQGLDFVDW